MALTSSDRSFRERQSGEYEATVTDPDGNAIPLSKVTALTLTLEDVDSGTKINSRDNQSVLGINGVAYTEAGVLTWTISPADNAIVGTACAGEVQVHRATFEIFWEDGGESYEHSWEVLFYITAVDSIS